jgi:hypothetical protein
MAIINICPLSSVRTTTITSEAFAPAPTTYLHHLMGLSIPALVQLADNANLPNPETEQTQLETRLVFCALAKQANFLLANRQALEVSDTTITTYFQTLKSLAIYTTTFAGKKWAANIPKFAPNPTTNDNFGTYLALLKQSKNEFVESRKQGAQHLLAKQLEMETLEQAENINAKLGMLSTKYAAKLGLETSTYSMPKQLAKDVTTCLDLAEDYKAWLVYIMASSIGTLKNSKDELGNSDVDEKDLIDAVESIEEWETSLNLKFAVLSFMRKKLEAFTLSASGGYRRASKLDLSELDFLLGDIEMKDSSGAAPQGELVEMGETGEAPTNSPLSLPLPLPLPNPAGIPNLTKAQQLLAKIKAKRN